MLFTYSSENIRSRFYFSSIFLRHGKRRACQGRTSATIQAEVPLLDLNKKETLQSNVSFLAENVMMDPHVKASIPEDLKTKKSFLAEENPQYERKGNIYATPKIVGHHPMAYFILPAK